MATVSEAHAKVKARVWQGVAQAGLDLSGVPKETVEALVDIVTESALIEMDATLQASAEEVMLAESDDVEKEGMATDEPTVDGEPPETVLWEGRPFLSVVTHYRITNERVRITRGLLSKRRIDIELLKILNITQTQKVGERMINVGDITLVTHYDDYPTVVLENVSDVQKVHEILRRARLDAREEANFAYREEM